MNIARTAALAAATLSLSLLAAPALASTPAHAPATAASASSSLGSLLVSSIPFTAAEVTANDDSTFTITWTAPRGTTVRVYTGATQTTVDTKHVVATGGATGSVTVKGLAEVDRRWFTLVPSKGTSLTLADRLVRLDGTVNFRDLGGYRTRDGHWVKMGEIYRSDALDKVSTDDLATIKKLGIGTVYDLRTDSERATAPDKVPAGTKDVVLDVLGSGSGITTMPTTPEAAEQMMITGERTMVSGAGGLNAYTTLLEAADDKGAILFHCTAGKDRTGWGAATILTALGVPADTIEDDYLASNDYRAEANAAALAQMPAAAAAVYKPLLDVRPEYLEAGYDEVDDTYGSFAAYLNRGLGLNLLELVKLRASLLVG